MPTAKTGNQGIFLKNLAKPDEEASPPGEVSDIPKISSADKLLGGSVPPNPRLSVGSKTMAKVGVGLIVGIKVSLGVGVLVGVGVRVRVRVGVFVGEEVGTIVGSTVGITVGTAVGHAKLIISP